jgi:hypothetical protein
MRVKVVSAVLLGVLVLSSLLVRASYGDDQADLRGSAKQTVLELWWNTRHPDSEVWIFLFDEHAGRCDDVDIDPVCLQVTEKDMPLFDADGNRIGRQLISCTVTDRTGWNCTLISKIRDGKYTDKGQIVVIGTKHPSDIHTLSVVGGTGAYEGVGGHAIQVGQDGRVTYTLHLTSLDSPVQ